MAAANENKPIVPTMREQAKDILAKLTKGQAVEDHEVESLTGATPEELGEMEIVKPKTALGHSRASGVFTKNMQNKFFVPVWWSGKTNRLLIQPNLRGLRHILSDALSDTKDCTQFIIFAAKIARLTFSPIALALDSLHHDIPIRRPRAFHRAVSMDHVFLERKTEVDCGERVDHYAEAKLRLSEMTRFSYECLQVEISTSQRSRSFVADYYHHPDLMGITQISDGGVHYSINHDWYSFGVCKSCKNLILEFIYIVSGNGESISLKGKLQKLRNEARRDYLINKVLPLLNDWCGKIDESAHRNNFSFYLDIAEKCISNEPNIDYRNNHSYKHLNEDTKKEFYFEYSLSTISRQLLCHYMKSENTHNQSMYHKATVSHCHACLLRKTVGIDMKTHQRKESRWRCDTECKYYCFECYTNGERLYCPDHGTASSVIGIDSYALLLYGEDQYHEGIFERDTVYMYNLLTHPLISNIPAENIIRKPLHRDDEDKRSDKAVLNGKPAPGTAALRFKESCAAMYKKIHNTHQHPYDTLKRNHNELQEDIADLERRCQRFQSEICANRTEELSDATTCTTYPLPTCSQTDTNYRLSHPCTQKDSHYNLFVMYSGHGGAKESSSKKVLHGSWCPCNNDEDFISVDQVKENLDMLTKCADCTGSCLQVYQVYNHCYPAQASMLPSFGELQDQPDSKVVKGGDGEKVHKKVTEKERSSEHSITEIAHVLGSFFRSNFCPTSNGKSCDNCKRLEQRRNKKCDGIYHDAECLDTWMCSDLMEQHGYKTEIIDVIKGKAKSFLCFYHSNGLRLRAYPVEIVSTGIVKPVEIPFHRDLVTREYVEKMIGDGRPDTIYLLRTSDSDSALLSPVWDSELYHLLAMPSDREFEVKHCQPHLMYHDAKQRKLHVKLVLHDEDDGFLGETMIPLSLDPSSVLIKKMIDISKSKKDAENTQLCNIFVMVLHHVYRYRNQLLKTENCVSDLTDNNRNNQAADSEENQQFTTAMMFESFAGLMIDTPVCASISLNQDDTEEKFRLLAENADRYFLKEHARPFDVKYDKSITTLSIKWKTDSWKHQDLSK